MTTLSITAEQAEPFIVKGAEHPECFAEFINNLNLPLDTDLEDMWSEFNAKHWDVEPDEMIENTISSLVNSVPWEFCEGAAQIRRDLEEYLTWVDKDQIWVRQYERNSWRKCANCGCVVEP